jgi:hypothetical protein
MNDPAMARFMVMNAMRFTGAALVVFSLLVIAGRVDIGLPREAAYAILAVGLIDALIVPTVLARRWRSRR